MLNWTEPRLQRFAVGAAALAALAVYANSLANGFAYDDYWIIETRGLVHQGLSRLPELLAAEYWPTEFDAQLYRPLTLFTYAADWAVWNGRPVGFHLLNVLLHATASALLTRLLLRFFPWWAALTGGLVFAIHPVHTEAVANVIGRAELLVAVFVLAACVIYTRASEENSLSGRDIAAIAVLYALAVASKENGILLPVLLLVSEWPILLRARRRWRPFLRTRLPLMVVLALVGMGYLAVRTAVIGAPIGGVPDRIFALDDSFGTRLFTMARVWPRYFELLLFPLDLSADYSPAVILPAAELTPLGAVGFLLVSSSLLVAMLVSRTVPTVTMAALWAVLTFLPVSNLIVLVEIVLAERTFYLPSVAVAVVASVALFKAKRSTRPWVAVMLATWIVGFSIHTVRRNPAWDSTQSVFEELRRSHPESSRLLWGIGEQYRQRGEWEEAKRWFGRSLEIWPHHAPYLIEFAGYLTERGDYAEAERLLADAVRLRPEVAAYHTRLALLRFRGGDSEAALATIEQGLRIAGETHVLHGLRANVFASRNEYDSASISLERAIALLGDSATGEYWNQLARYRAAAGDTAGSLEATAEARKRDTRDSTEVALPPSEM